MSDLTMVDELIDQFGRTWQELRDALVKTPASEWRRADAVSGAETDYLVPARLAYHILRTTDMYATHMGYEEYKPHRKYTLDNWEGPVEALPEREEVFTFVNECEVQVKEWLLDLSEEGLMEEEEKYPWTGAHKLGRALYLLRHNQWHIAEINTLLRLRGLEPGDW
jgi:hypothetical protein